MVVGYVVGDHSYTMAPNSNVDTSPKIKAKSHPGTEILFVTTYFIVIHVLCLDAEHLIDRKTTTDKRADLAVGQQPECRPQLKFQIIILKANVCHLAQIVGFILLTTFLIECQHRL